MGHYCESAMVQKRNWVWTLNVNEYLGIDDDVQNHQPNWDDYMDRKEGLAVLIKEVMRVLEATYYIYGHEVGLNGGNLHLQGYSEFGRGIRSNTIINQFTAHGLPHPHMEQRFGSREQAVAYSKKDGDFIESSEIVNQKSTRAQAIEIVKKEGYAHLVKTDLEKAHLVQSRVCLLYEDLKIGPDRYNDPPIEFNWYFGEPGSGKTYAAIQWLSSNGTEEYAFKTSGDTFFVTYHTKINNVLLDNAVLQTTQEMKDILGFGERNPYTAHVKGSQYFVHNKKLAVTSVFSPFDLYESMPEHMKKGHKFYELSRRMTRLIQVDLQEQKEVDKAYSINNANIDLNAPANQHAAPAALVPDIFNQEESIRWLEEGDHL